MHGGCKTDGWWEVQRLGTLIEAGAGTGAAPSAAAQRSTAQRACGSCVKSQLAHLTRLHRYSPPLHPEPPTTPHLPPPPHLHALQVSLRNQVMVMSDWVRTKIFGRNLSDV